MDKLKKIIVEENAAYIIQKHWRIYLVKKIEIIPSKMQTKEWRKKQEWYRNGKSNECEKYQKRIIHRITEKTLISTRERINREKCTIENIYNIFKLKNGFEYTEDFDGKIIVNNSIYYFNLKMVIGKGGAQTRTLRDVYSFIKSQMDILAKYDNVFFINLLDGDESYRQREKFIYLLRNISSNIFIGNTNEFRQFWISNILS